MGEAYDCQSCGACCAEAGEVTVTPEDNVPTYLTRSVRGRMGFASDDHELGIRRMAKECPGHRCRALKGTIGVQVRCGIYDQRPAVCRSFEPGSEQCLESRATMAWKRARLEMKPWGYDTRPIAR